ncbi:alpha-N-acetylneuraminide alpha-2,8-sialyltransferase-like, partial [Sceloporus undulatus]|uniref:alpha-N-acetylneuraminide alpha-2,8-sialyltransferase-like n=1 Tax=Sceloporus undulatus TaxID=8520 RepID=UPI001C4ABB3D
MRLARDCAPASPPSPSPGSWMAPCLRRCCCCCCCRGPPRGCRWPVGASALAFFVLGWLYIFPGYRLPDQAAIVRGVRLQQGGQPWSRNLSAGLAFRSAPAPKEAASSSSSSAWLAFSLGFLGQGLQKGLPRLREGHLPQ